MIPTFIAEMSKNKKIDTSERDVSATQSLGDLLSGAGLNVSKQIPPEPVKSSPIKGVLTRQTEPLYVRMEKKGRHGKVVTLISEFTILTGEIETLAKELKTKCGVGGSVKDREIVLQGDHRKKVIALLNNMGFKTKGG